MLGEKAQYNRRFRIAASLAAAFLALAAHMQPAAATGPRPLDAGAIDIPYPGAPHHRIAGAVSLALAMTPASALPDSAQAEQNQNRPEPELRPNYAGDLTQAAYLKASNAEGRDKFGVSMAIDGAPLVVGARNESGSYTSTMGSPNNDAFLAGAVYVYTRSVVRDVDADGISEGLECQY
jgi:hypothetical protein